MFDVNGTLHNSSLLSVFLSRANTVEYNSMIKMIYQVKLALILFGTASVISTTLQCCLGCPFWPSIPHKPKPQSSPQCSISNVGNQHTTPEWIIRTREFEQDEEYCNGNKMPWNFSILQIKTSG